MTEMTKLAAVSCRVLAMLLLLWQIGCAKDKDEDDDATGDDDAANDVTIAPENMVDDLEDGDDALIVQNGRVGDWYIFNDESGGQQFAFDPKTIASVGWQSAENIDFDFEIDNVGFY
jgi:hypothetical protein